MKVIEWMEQIGDAIGQPGIFKSYSEQVFNTRTIKYVPPSQKNEDTIDVYEFKKGGWDGYKLLKSFMNVNGTGVTDGIEIIDKRHADLINKYLNYMYTGNDTKQQLCPGGKLCLEGVGLTEMDPYLITSPFTCPAGSYCLRGSESVIGTGLCPIGYYCPEQTAYPNPTKPGTFSGNYGAIEASMCSPGTF